MKPNTRLLIRFTLPDSSMKSWGYDYHFYKNAEQLRAAIIADFEDFPENTDINLFYYEHDEQIEAVDAQTLADTAVSWLIGFGAFNGN